MAKQPSLNTANACSHILGEIAKTCFLIGSETDYEAHFRWAAHVNEVEVEVRPKGAHSHVHNVMELDEYMELPTRGVYGKWATSEFGTNTYPKVKSFSDDLKNFYERALAAANR